MACWTNNPIYDPWTITINEPKDLENAIAYSLATGRRLELTFGHRPLIEQYKPEVLEMMEDHGLFHPSTVIPGLEEKQFDVHITELRRLDPRRITRTYRLDDAEAEKLRADPRGVLASLGIDLGPESELEFEFQRDESLLYMRNSWAEHCKLRVELEKLRQ